MISGRRIDCLRERAERPGLAESAYRLRRAAAARCGSVRGSRCCVRSFRPGQLDDLGQLGPQPQARDGVMREPWPHHCFRETAHRQGVLLGRIRIAPVVAEPGRVEGSRSLPEEVLEPLLRPVLRLQCGLQPWQARPAMAATGSARPPPVARSTYIHPVSRSARRIRRPLIRESTAASPSPAALELSVRAVINTESELTLAVR